MTDINILPYQDAFMDELLKFELGDHQKDFTVVPKEVITDSIENVYSKPFVVFNNENKVVGFFILEKYYQYEGFSTPHNSVYVRALSINEKLQGNGYGKKLAFKIPNFAKKHIFNTSYLYLVVDYKNVIARNLYERAGFLHIASKPNGPVGEERLYCLDLNNKYMNFLDLKFIINKEKIKIEILDKNKDKIGYITGYLDNDKYRILNIFVNENERRRGVAASSLRMLGPHMKKYLGYINTFEMEISHNNMFENVLIQSGFTKFRENNLIVYKKIIK